MKTIARTFYKMPVTVMFFITVPLFYFLFVLAYKPFDMEVFLATGQGHYSLNLIVSTLIVLGVMVFSRMLLFLLRGVLDLNWSLYVLWCFGEAILAGLFLSIPMGIGWGALCILYMAGILVFPLSLLSMAVQLHVLNKRADLAPAVDEKTLIRFYDEQKRLKLVVASDAVLYIEAEENYVHIVHLDNGKVKDFELRSSMRALEEVLQRHGLVRCHRSFFVNSAHVDLLKKDVNGYALAQLDQEKIKNIPVSKKYYDSIVSLL